MTRGVVLFAITCALVCVLIPWPALWPVTFGGLAFMWIATPTSKSSPKGRRSSRSEKASSALPR